MVKNPKFGREKIPYFSFCISMCYVYASPSNKLRVQLDYNILEQNDVEWWIPLIPNGIHFFGIKTS